MNAAALQPSDPPGAGTRRSAPHILVTNDTQENLDRFRDLLEDERYRVTLSSFAFQEVRDVVRIALDPESMRMVPP